jgi:hypothetical protein
MRRDARSLPDEIRRRLQGRRKVAGGEVTDSETYDWPPTSTYIQNPPYFRRHGQGTKGVIKNIDGARVLALLGDMITTDHISPGRFVQGHHAGRQISDRTAGSGEGLQLLRLAPRQPRGDDARHLRQYPHQERDARWRRGRLYQGPDGKQTSIYDASMAYQAAGHAAGDLRRHRIRRRLVARLGGQGHGASGRQGGDRRIVRAHPPLEPGRHGRDPVRVHPARPARRWA